MQLDVIYSENHIVELGSYVDIHDNKKLELYRDGVWNPADEWNPVNPANSPDRRHAQ